MDAVISRMAPRNFSAYLNSSTCANSTSPANTNLSVPSPLYLTLSKEKEHELVATIIITATLSFTGAFANGLVLFATWPWSRSRAKSGLNLLIFHFVGANFVMCFINIPIGLFMIAAARAGYTVSSGNCRYVQGFLTTVWGTINWIDMLLAMNRFVALFLPHHYRQLTKKTIILSAVAFAWFVSFVVTLLHTLGVGGKMGLLLLGYCAALVTGTVGEVLTSFQLYIPYLITGVAAFLILLKACYRSGRVGNSNVNDAASRAVARRFKMGKMVLFVFLWTGICIVPDNIITLNFPWLFGQNPVSMLWIRTCMALQYGFTPCILLIHHSEYRKRVLSLMRSVGLAANGGNAPSMSTNRPNSREV